MLPSKVLYCSNSVILVKYTEKLYNKIVPIVFSLFVCFLVALLLSVGGSGFLPIGMIALFNVKLAFEL